MLIFAILILWYICRNSLWNWVFQIQFVHISIQIYSSYCVLVMQIRPIIQSDNSALAKIIRDTLTEFGANHKSARFLSNFINV